MYGNINVDTHGSTPEGIWEDFFSHSEITQENFKFQALKMEFSAVEKYVSVVFRDVMLWVSQEVTSLKIGQIILI